MSTLRWNAESLDSLSKLCASEGEKVNANAAATYTLAAAVLALGAALVERIDREHAELNAVRDTEAPADDTLGVEPTPPATSRRAV